VPKLTLRHPAKYPITGTGHSSQMSDLGDAAPVVRPHGHRHDY
jgi:hypothetical protein